MGLMPTESSVMRFCSCMLSELQYSTVHSYGHMVPTLHHEECAVHSLGSLLASRTEAADIAGALNMGFPSPSMHSSTEMVTRGDSRPAPDVFGSVGTGCRTNGNNDVQRLGAEGETDLVTANNTK